MTEENKEEVEEKPKEETITISKSAFESFKEDMEKLKANNSMLMEVADKDRMARFFARNKKDMPDVVRLNLWGGKVIVGWKLKEDIVDQDPITQKWYERQTIKLALEDKTVVEIPYLSFTRNHTKAEAKVVKEVRDETEGRTALSVVRNDNGKEYTLDDRFVN